MTTNINMEIALSYIIKSIHNLQAQIDLVRDDMVDKKEVEFLLNEHSSMIEQIGYELNKAPTDDDSFFSCDDDEEKMDEEHILELFLNSLYDLRDEAKELTREDVINLAMSDIIVGLEPTDGYEFRVVTNHEKKTCVALAYNEHGQVVSKGISRCHPSDCFNEYIGLAVAIRKMGGLDIPDSYCDTPQPKAAKHGDFVTSRLGELTLVVDLKQVDTKQLLLLDQKIFIITPEEANKYGYVVTDDSGYESVLERFNIESNETC